MKTPILLTIICFLCLSLSAQTKSYVWNISGTSIMKSPSQNSETLETIELGQELTSRLTDGESFETIQASNSGYPLHGEWLPIKSEDQTGYVFSGDLSVNEPPVIDVEGFLKVDLDQIMGEKQSDSVQIKTIQVGASKFDVEVQTTFYEHGFYSYQASDSCFDHTYHFNDLSFIEVFHLAMSMYCLQVDDQVILPGFFEEQEGEIHFWGNEATVEVILWEDENGWQLASYDCT